mgnify:FL=1|tara:strand:- start:109 stop:558 length:450 start_codon:yes stop_codon:yes gene_type:complete
MKKKYVTFKKVKEDIKIINSKINKSNWIPDVILSVNRGGCVPGVFLSHIRDLNHEVLSFKQKISNYNDEYIKKIKNNNLSILIFDDINDTGDTLTEIKNNFKDYVINIRFAVLINNKSSSFKVDYWGSEIDKNIDNSWIVFPWENIDAE